MENFSRLRLLSFDNFLRPLIHDRDAIFRQYVTPGMRVLDVGCGAGFISVGLARIVGEGGAVVSTDVHGEMLALVKERARKEGLQNIIKTHLCKKDGIGVDGAFEFISAFWMVHEVPDTRAFLEEIRSCLSPGGIFLVAEPLVHVSTATFERMLEVADAVGLEQIGRPRIRVSNAVAFAARK